MNDLNDLINEIEVPSIELDSAIDKAMIKGKKEKKKKALKRKVIMRGCGGVAAACILITIVGIVDPKAVSAVPLIGSIFNHFKADENLKNFEEFSTSVNKTVESSGIKVTINDIALDNNMFAITTTIEGKGYEAGKGIMGGIELNGKGSSSRDDKYHKIDDNTTEVILYGNIAELSLSDDVDVEINFVYLGDIKGEWNFKFSTSKKKTSELSKTIDLNQKIKLPDSELEVVNLVMGPFGNTLNIRGRYYENNGIRSSGIERFRVLDDKGNILYVRSPGATSSDKVYYEKLEILNDLSDVKRLTIIPIFESTGEVYKRIDDFEEPIYQCSVDIIGKSQDIITKSRRVTDRKRSDGYLPEYVRHAYRIDKSSFVSLNELAGKIIPLNKETSATVQAVEVSRDNTIITLKASGDYSEVGFSYTLLVDEDFNYTEWDYDRDDEASIDANNNIIKIKLPAVDSSKKYKVAVEIIKDPVINNDYKMELTIK